MFSQGNEGGEGGIDKQGHASPKEIPSIVVRVEGQTFERPLIRTDHRVGTVITGTLVAIVEGWERRKSKICQYLTIKTAQSSYLACGLVFLPLQKMRWFAKHRQALI